MPVLKHQMLCCSLFQKKLEKARKVTYRYWAQKL